mgnify:CR=1 FL=1
MPTTPLCAGSVIYNCTNSTAVLTTEGIIGRAIGGFFFRVNNRYFHYLLLLLC